MQVNQHKTEPQEQPSLTNIASQLISEIECRICLNTANEDSESFLAPCSCLGSVQYVHEDCLKKWIEKVIEEVKEKPSKGKAHVSCELCGANIYFAISKSNKCHSRDQIAESIKSRPKLFTTFIVILLLCSGFFFALLDFMINSGWKVLENYNAFLIILMICAEVVFLSIALTMLGLLTKNYLTYQILEVSSLQQKNTKVNKSLQLTKKHSSLSKN